MLIHQFGIPADCKAFQELSREKNLVLIEDAACGLGSKQGSKSVGTFGLAGVLSFHPRKVLSTGEGGMILTDNEELALLARSLGNHGKKFPEGKITERVGHNFRMSEFQAALGLWALDRVLEAIDRRIMISRNYEETLKEIRGVECVPELPGFQWNRQSYPIRILGERRDLIAAALHKEGIETSLGPVPAHMHPFIEHLLHPPRLPETERAYHETLLLPMYAALPQESQKIVLDRLTEALDRVKAR